MPHDHMNLEAGPPPKDDGPKAVSAPDGSRGVITGRGRGSPALEAHKARTLVVGTVTYQRDGAHDPKVIPIKSYRLHAEALQPYERELEAGPEPLALEAGWIKETGLVVVRNNAPVPRPEPIDPKAKAAGGRVAPAPGSLFVLLAVDEPEASRDQWSPPRMGPQVMDVIPPGDTRLYSPPDARRLLLRADSTVPATVVVFGV
jgi:hypothetical protein